MKKSILALSMLSLVFVSCKKDKNEEVTPTKENLTGSYKVTAMTYSGVNVWNNSNEALNQFEPCERDDVYTLKSDLTGEITDEGTKCDPTTADTGTWNLATGNKITVEMGSLSVAGTIKSWNNKDLVLEDSSQGAVISITLHRQ